jgi:hypothetical protein
MDFTLKKYKLLLEAIINSDYSIQTFEDFVRNPEEKAIVLRHDVDRLPENAAQLAFIEHNLRIKASYYFRVIPSVFKQNLIKECVELGHEVSYHYEDITICRGDIDKAIVHFDNYLQKFRKIYPSKTICMHGSPLSKWDNRDLWSKYNYHDYGIIAEPYFDVDYSKVLYITDTGRKWNKSNISVRDKVDSAFSFNINSTDDIISKIKNKELPGQIIINTHPHRWFDNLFGWSKEYVIQNIKNVVKFALIKFNGR